MSNSIGPGLYSDLRDAFRQLKKSKGLSAATLATLALCIGTTTAIFSMVYALMLKPLPFHEPDRIVELYSSAVKAGLNKMPANVVMYLDYSKNATSYEALALWTRYDAQLGEDGAIDSVSGARATAEIFELLRVQPVLGSFDNRRAVMLLLVAFAGMALFLAALGIYGVLAYDVSQRTREIGIRSAIGATREQLVAMVLGQGLWKAGIGLGVGLVGAWLLSRTMTSLLFQVKPTEPIVYAGGSLLLMLVAVVASWLPARRAARIDPLVALRAE